MTSPALDTALAQPFHSEVVLVRIEWPGGTMRLMTSPGELMFDSETYVHSDPTGWGGIIDIADFQEGAGTQQQAALLTLHLSPSVLTAYTSSNYQGSRVDVWRGLRSLTGPELIGVEPIMVGGWVSTCEGRLWDDTAAVEVLLVSHQERRFIPTGGRVHTTAFRQSFAPSDLFEEFAAGTAAVAPGGSIGNLLPPGYTGGGGGAATRAIGKLITAANLQA